MDLQDLGADFLCRQQVILRQKNATSRCAIANTLQRRPSRKQKKKSNTMKSRCKFKGASLGGPWRAFLHDRYGGQFLTKRLLQQASGEYSAIKHAAGEDWKYYKEMGLMATLAGRAGHKVLKQEKPGRGLGNLPPGLQKLRDTHSTALSIPGGIKCLESQLAELSERCKKENGAAQEQESRNLAELQLASVESHKALATELGLETSGHPFAWSDTTDPHMKTCFQACPGANHLPTALTYFAPADLVALVPWLQYQ